ncbi:MAG: hypothetical protein QNJ72_22495 [Pleurocapsa sp. MO_226.B13]|nr:hypothetical protein [Pleurocapsa sp. MO_226.B13]
MRNQNEEHKNLVITYARGETGSESLVIAIVTNKADENGQNIPQSAHVIRVGTSDIWNDATLDIVVPKLLKQLDEKYPRIDRHSWGDDCQLIIDSNLHQYCRQANFIIDNDGKKKVGDSLAYNNIRFLGVASAHRKLAEKFIEDEKLIISSDLAGEMPSSLTEDDLGICFALLAAYLRMIPDDDSVYWNAIKSLYQL